MIWQFLNSGLCPAEENMAIDIHLAHQVAAGQAFPTLRVYGWQPYAVSIGYHERDDDFDRTKIENDGLHIVRRPTGGRAILHAEELTYSVIMPVEPMGPREIYRWINIGLLRGLELLGIHATLAIADDHFQTIYRDPASVPCFASSARSEIQVDGRKMIGSAQRRYGSVILQHGSLLLGPEHRNIVRYLAPHTDIHRKQMEETLLEKTIDARAILGRIIDYDEAAMAVQRGFVEALGITFSDLNLQATGHHAPPTEQISITRH